MHTNIQISSPINRSELGCIYGIGLCTKFVHFVRSSVANDVKVLACTNSASHGHVTHLHEVKSNVIMHPRPILIGRQVPNGKPSG